jgi:maltooligosyltrehalose trehalohydrolase
MPLEPQLARSPLISPGARVAPDGVHYRIWAPDHSTLRVRIKRTDGREAHVPLTRQADGYFSAHDADGRAADRYHFELADGRLLADPASRFQPEGVHGPSECIDPSSYSWRNEPWTRPAWRGQVVYELHLGTFTEAGTFRAAIERLPHVRGLGAEAIQIMPVGDFAGNRNWGYDGVALFAPARCYGRPDDFRSLIDAAHGHGLAVILDVVYNHVGPDGNTMTDFAQAYFHESRANAWGRAFNLDGPDSEPVRRFFLSNVAYWFDEYKIDGVRLDATHAITDASERHLLAEIADLVHDRGGFAIAEDERNACELLSETKRGGHGLDAVWSDDFHHELRVSLTGIRESYFAAYRGGAGDVARTLQHGWSYTGQPYVFWQGRPRGAACDHLPPAAFVYCIENHDQVGNRALGERLEALISPEQFRAASALICLSPYAPLLFMGQEWAASTPFLFFTDHAGEVGRNVSLGRRREFEQTGLNGGIPFDEVPDPQNKKTFEASRLRWSELSEPEHAAVFALYRACLHERATWLRDATAREHWRVRALGDVLALRYQPPGRPVRLLLVCLRVPAAQATDDPMLQPPAGQRWRSVLHTEEKRFGGSGAGDVPHGWPRPEDVPSGRPSETDAALRWQKPGAVLLLAEDAPCR